GVTFHGRTVQARQRTVTFSDGTQLNPDVVVWATGFRLDYSWVQLPVFTPDGALVHRRGITESPGLYFLGLPWMHTRGSALLGWVEDDAQFLAQQIQARAGSTRSHVAPVAPLPTEESQPTGEPA